MQTLLANVKKQDVVAEPFPYIVIKDPIPLELCNQLLAEFPSLETVTKGAPVGDNKRFDYTVKDIREQGKVTPLWRDFIEAQASRAFIDDLYRIFGDHIKKLYPDYEKKYGSFS